MKIRYLYICLIIFPTYAQEVEVQLRHEMVTDIEDMVIETRAFIGTEKLSSEVIDAMKNVPRHLFVPEAYQRYAYENRPLPIGSNQTISQHYIVALMTELAQINENSIVLEIGTGSGYQAAVLAELVEHVYSIEIIEPLGRKARQTLEQLGYHNVTVRIGDGYNGWEEYAPFDAILVTAAPENVPQPLIDQLKPGGRMVIPVGSQMQSQSLRVLVKEKDGSIEEKDVLPVGFVPLTREREF